MHHTPQKTRQLPLRRAVFFVSTAVLAVLIAILTLGSVSAPTVPGNDKIYHIIAFAALLLPCAFLYRRALYYILPGAILFGGMIELIQPYVGRNGEWADFGADAIGAMLGVALGLAVRSVFSPRKRA